MTSNVDGNVDTPEAPPQARFATLGEVRAYDEGCRLAARSLGEAADELVKLSKPLWNHEHVDSIITGALRVLRHESYYTPDQVRAFRLGVEETFVAMRTLAEAIQVAFQPGTVVHTPLHGSTVGKRAYDLLVLSGIRTTRTLVSLTKEQLAEILGGDPKLLDDVTYALTLRGMSLADS